MAQRNEIAKQLRDARSGSAGAFGDLLEGFRQYLLLVANQELRKDLHPKLAPSDLVQDTFLQAQRSFERFQGTTAEEVLAWLRKILLNNLRETVRHYGRCAKRNIRREVRFSEYDHGVALDESASSRLQKREANDAVLRALEGLSDDHRQVITLRNFELRPFAEIARVMHRSPEAARKLWSRAIEALGDQLGGSYVP